MIIKNKAIKNDNMDDDEGYVYVGSCSIPSRIVKLESITGKLFTYRTRVFQKDATYEFTVTQEFETYSRIGWRGKVYDGFKGLNKWQADFEKYTIDNAINALP